MHIYTPRPLKSGTPWLWICALRRHRGALTRITVHGPWSPSGFSDRRALPPDPIGSLRSPGKTAPMRRTASNAQTLRYRGVFSGIWHSQLLSRLVSFSSSLFYYPFAFLRVSSVGLEVGAALYSTSDDRGTRQKHFPDKVRRVWAGAMQQKKSPLSWFYLQFRRFRRWVNPQ